MLIISPPQSLFEDELSQRGDIITPNKLLAMLKTIRPMCISPKAMIFYHREASRLFSSVASNFDIDHGHKKHLEQN